MKSDLAFFRAYADKQKCNVDDPDPAGQACREARPCTSCHCQILSCKGSGAEDRKKHKIKPKKIYNQQQKKTY